MDTRIKGFYFHRSGPEAVDIFGYANKGLPGIDIIGLGKFGKSCKEKLIYLSKTFEVKIPLRRYVLCVEDNNCQGDMVPSDYQLLELPLLILFWSLVGRLPIRRLEDCFSSGKVSVNGTIFVCHLTAQDWEKVTNRDNYAFYKLISNTTPDMNQAVPILPIESIFETVPGIRFQTVVQSSGRL